jgi:hypothetical protein
MDIFEKKRLPSIGNVEQVIIALHSRHYPTECEVTIELRYWGHGSGKGSENTRGRNGAPIGRSECQVSGHGSQRPFWHFHHLFAIAVIVIRSESLHCISCTVTGFRKKISAAYSNMHV